jgi:hypothetical protein
VTRPDALHNRPFFRPEAEAHRRHRHLGEVDLARPMSVRLAFLLPVLASLLLLAMAAGITLRARMVPVVTPERLKGGAIRLVVAQARGASLSKGDAVELQTGSGRRIAAATVIGLAPVPCSATGTSGCTAVLARPDATLDGSQTMEAVAVLRGRPARYFRFFDGFMSSRGE